MRKDWEIKKLGELGNIFSGNSINEKEKKSYMDLSKKGLFYVATKDISSDSEIEYKNGILIPDECLSKFKIAHKDSVLICAEGGSAGKKLAYNSEYDICFVNKLFAFEANNSIFSKFVFYYYQSSDFVKHFKNRLAGLIGGVSLQKFKEIPCPIPPLEEQKRIVKILDEKFAQLESLKANAQTNLQNAKDLFQSQLAKAFSNTTWEKKRLETITKIKSGFAFKGSAFKTTGEYQVLRLGNVKQNYLRIDEKAVFVSGISTSVLSKAKVNIGDLVVTQTGTKGKRDYGFVAIVDRDNLLLNQRLAAITTAECLYNRYLLYYSYTKSFKDQFFANEGGTVGQGNIGLTDIKEIEIPLPPLPEQKRIVKELDTLSEKVKALCTIYEKQIADCEELKKSLLAKAFEGNL